MTHIVDIPNFGTLEFPDEMSMEQINAVIKKTLSQTNSNISNQQISQNNVSTAERILEQPRTEASLGRELLSVGAGMVNPLLDLVGGSITPQQSQQEELMLGFKPNPKPPIYDIRKPLERLKEENPGFYALGEYGPLAATLGGSALKLGTKAVKRLGTSIFETPEKATKKASELYDIAINHPEISGVKIKTKNFSDYLIDEIAKAEKKSSPQSEMIVAKFSDLLNKSKKNISPSEAQEWIQDLKELASNSRRGKALSTESRDWPMRKMATQYEKAAKHVENDLLNGLRGQGFPEAADAFNKANKFYRENVIPLREFPVNKGKLALETALIGASHGLGHVFPGGGLLGPLVSAGAAALIPKSPLYNMGARYFSTLAGGPGSIGRDVFSRKNLNRILLSLLPAMGGN